MPYESENCMNEGMQETVIGGDREHIPRAEGIPESIFSAFLEANLAFPQSDTGIVSHTLKTFWNSGMDVEAFAATTLSLNQFQAVVDAMNAVHVSAGVNLRAGGSTHAKSHLISAARARYLESYARSSRAHVGWLCRTSAE